jgi:hypothetical protein
MRFGKNWQYECGKNWQDEPGDTYGRAKKYAWPDSMSGTRKSGQLKKGERKKGDMYLIS